MSAIGEASKIITFKPLPGGNFYGLQFESPGPDPIPANSPIAISVLQYVRLDSAQGINA